MATVTALLLHLLLLPWFTLPFSIASPMSTLESNLMIPFNCSQNHIKTCNSYLYHTSNGHNITQLSNFYSVNSSQITQIAHGNNQDYLISVRCSCENIDGFDGYFSDVVYRVGPKDTSKIIYTEIFNGQVWNITGADEISPGVDIPVHLLCGCLVGDSEVIVTYTVQVTDTLLGIASTLSSTLEGIEKLNGKLITDPDLIDIGWVLFVPMKVKGKEGSRNKKKLTLVIALAVSTSLLATGVLIYFRRNRAQRKNSVDPEIVTKCSSAKSLATLQNQYLKKATNEDVPIFGGERPVIYELEEIEEATNHFDETKKIGEGGYGIVYSGILGNQEVAIKKMKSCKSKEFFAELKVLCKIHHRNVVELIGYASGDDHLYLVYEHVKNGSLNDHLHNPLMKGHQPLHWIARVQIALDTARGIEYIHDHTKDQCVHRDIKTSNILLDEGLRAKVADFGLAKLVERTSAEDCIATRLVGTPGYLPPESVIELQMTPKSDVFAFGVVLAELLTGQRALIRDTREGNKMKSLISTVYQIFRDDLPESSLEAVMDPYLKGTYPLEEAYKVAEIAASCLSEEAINRPEMREIVVKLSNIVMTSVEWEASLGGNSQVFSGVFSGR